ncbi:MAG: nicotinate (nicotinamide) nucleotide adenylyltransferase [Clostridia bacterium]|nr:nicotinate (nicotinamide) nucleotide adenylyltransferase [Clostridia bacterium]
MKIAIFGGAFNPVHNEHINIVLSAKNSLGMDKIIIMPTFISPHKSGSMIARAKDRLKMCRLAFDGIEGVEVSDYEVKRGGVSYSYITCRHFKKLYPEDELYFIIGSDNLDGFHLWREPEEILKCVTLIVCTRVEAAMSAAKIKKFMSRFNKELIVLGYVGKAVSSTRVRALAALGEDISPYVPEAVKRHISHGQLYYLPELAPVKKYLTEERWRHTVGVAVTAAENCRRVNVYEIDAITAAALHDCAKYLESSAPELKGFKCPENVPAPVVHQYSGAFVAEHTFGIKDKDILNAVRYHTSGRENMSGIEKLIYLADLLEEGRDFDGVEALRKLLSRDIDECLYAALESQVEYLSKSGKPVYPLTRRAYEYLKETKNGQ